MPTKVHEFTWPDRVVVGTIGLPGARTFYLQVRAGTQIVSIALEKQQSAQLAEKIDEILDQLITLEGNPFSIPASTPIELVDNEQLEPVEEQFRTGAMSLGWDPTTVQLVIEAYPIAEVEANEDGTIDDESLDQLEEAAEMLRVRIPVGTARAFAKRTREIVGAGRPTCPLCGEPVDPGGHSCAPSEA
ncbi:DUF3090 domain-containing protein [Arthrobacter sp. CAN_A1]|uniref:DUF3090 domain-containing protein n=1 Tax=Arthrobacter sp. CAN_A1 TaxID=2787717 RepID=UPI0018CBC015